MPARSMTSKRPPTHAHSQLEVALQARTGRRSCKTTERVQSCVTHACAASSSCCRDHSENALSMTSARTCMQRERLRIAFFAPEQLQTQGPHLCGHAPCQEVTIPTCTQSWQGCQRGLHSRQLGTLQHAHHPGSPFRNLLMVWTAEGLVCPEARHAPNVQHRRMDVRGGHHVMCTCCCKVQQRERGKSAWLARGCRKAATQRHKSQDIRLIRWVWCCLDDSHLQHSHARAPGQVQGRQNFGDVWQHRFGG